MSRSWSEVFAEMKKGSDEQEKAFRESLREPDFVRVYEDGDHKIEYGYWRVPEGIVRLRKGKKGYSSRAPFVYEEPELSALNALYCLKEREMFDTTEG